MRSSSVFVRPLLMVLLGVSMLGAGCLSPDDSDPEISGIEQDVSGPPATVTTTAASPTSVTVSWTPVVDAFKYYLFQQTGPGASTYIGTILAPGTSRTVTGLVSGTTYTFRVVTSGTDGTESAPSTGATITLGATSGAPTNVTVTPVGATQLDVAFSLVTNARKYYLYQSLTSGGARTYIGTIVDPTSSRSVTGLMANTNYCYELQTSFLDGSESGFSAPVCATTGALAGAPTGVTATAISDTRINVQWNLTTGQPKYLVYQSAAGGAAPYTQVGTVFDPNHAYLAVNLTANTQYCFKVSSVSSSNVESVQSGSVCATTLTAGGGNFQGFYKFDERTGTAAGDSSGFNRTATLSGGAVFTAADRAQIDDNQSSVSIPSTSTAVVTTPAAAGFNLVGSFSVVFWAKIPVAGDVRFLGMRGANCGALGWEMGQDSTGLYFAGENSQKVSFGSTLATGNWAHIAVSYTGGTMSTYVNGVATATGAYSPQNSIQTGITMGHPGGCAGGAVLLDHVQIYGRAVTASEIVTQGTLPPAPTNLTVSSKTSVSETLTWTGVAGATSYILSRGTAAGNEQFYTHIPTGTSFTPDHLTPGTQYSWTVRAVVNGLYSNASNSAVATTNAAPDAPTGVTATAISDTRINVTWGTVATATKYYVYMATGTGAYVFKGSVVASSSSPSFLAVNLAPSTTYSFQIQAEDAGQITSAMSAPATATTPAM